MLPGKIDRNKTYHKVTNFNEYHHGLQYKTGLNINPMPFNRDPEVSCCKEGIYFTTPKYIYNFFWMGYWIREITIPKDAEVVLDPSGTKYRTNKIIIGKKHSFDWYFNNLFINKWFDKKTFPQKDYWSLNKHCQKYKHIWGN